MTAALRERPWFRRLPILVVLAAGLWLWKGGGSAEKRELIWLTGSDASSIRGVEIQIWEPGGALLKREELAYPAGPGAEIVQNIPLSAGSYEARIFIRRGQSGASEHHAQVLEVGADDKLVLSLTRP